MKIKKVFLILIICLLFLSSCSKEEKLDPKNPITLDLWHNYGGQMKNTMDSIIDEFNDTVGKEKGIIVNVTSISGSATLHEKLAMAANDEPNSPKLPDITTLYPNTALMLAQKGLLADIDTQFTKEELSSYISEFVEEGRLEDRKLYVFPTAKSTEVMFVNMTVFNRFMKDNKVDYDDLKSFEGIIKVAEKYYNWTDNQTPDIKNDGKSLLTYDSIFNMSQVAYQQLDENFIVNDKLNLSSPEFERIWSLYYEPAVRGYVAIYDGYGSDLAKTGNVICSIGSTAGVLFYSPTVTYEDNITESVEYLILPYPTIDGGKKVAIQRGGGMSIIKTNEIREYASGIFLKWFTKPVQNLKFVSSTGYLPVTKEAFDTVMLKVNGVTDENIKKLLITAREMQEEYTFFVPPTFDKFDELQDEYNENMKATALNSRVEYLKLLNDMDEDTAYNSVSKDNFQNFMK